jgi:prepilin-type N-terminal cleavage/methylation domain-containing protein/prepilin-type processing-associated H-X9-DG protein
MKALRAFSLTELLVAIAIVAILASLLLPAFGRARGKSKAAFCLNNLKQWGTATMLYVAATDLLPEEGKGTPLESDLANPRYQGWYVQLPEQMGLPRYADMPWRMDPALEPERSVWICPSNPRRANITATSHNLFHYCLNDEHDGTGDQDRRRTKLHAVPHPSRVVWLFDSKNKPAIGWASFVHTNLHGGGAQFLFLDGHAALFKSSAYRDPHGGLIRDNPDLVWRP